MKRHATHYRFPVGAFSLVEVMVASMVLVFGIVSAITAMQSGLKALDTARNLATATQLMQTEMERLRLKSWSQLEAVQLSGATTVAPDAAASSLPAQFACTRRITSPKTDMKEITLVATWNGYDGRAHTARLVTRYGRNGLSDYISTAH